MKIRILPLLLALTVCLTVFAGCQSSELKSYSDEPVGSEEPADATAALVDYKPSYEAYDPDTVMLTANGRDITWGELFFWYHYIVGSTEANYGKIDWEDEDFLGAGDTAETLVKNDALEMIKFYSVINLKALENNVTLSDDDRAELEELWQANISSFGEDGEQKFLDQMMEMFQTKELYDYFNETSLLITSLMKELYGESGEKLDPADVIARAEQGGYVRAKHILLRTSDDAGAQLDEAASAQKLETAQTLLAELQAITDPAELESRFDELIAEYGEDPGAAMYPQGYTFTSGKMVAEFEAAAFALEDYTISEIVETAHGYHIILRLPLDPGAAVEFASDGSPYSLAYLMAQEIFDEDAQGWIAESEVVFTEEYENLDMAELFGKAIYPPEA